MPKKKLMHLTWFAAGIIFFSIIIFFITPGLSVQVFSPELTRMELPVRLNIPKINVQTNLESVGLTPQGAVGVPTGIANAAWFNLGPRPGEIGSAIITGHYGRYKNGTPALFNNLFKLRPGDKLSIQDKFGTNIIFMVRALKIYKETDDVSAIFNAPDLKAHLNLITCEGVWDSKEKSYSNRLVVFADKVE